MKLSKKTATALCGIDWALNELAELPPQAGEFTCNEFCEASRKTASPMDRDQCHRRLQRMKVAGQLVSRLVTIDGRRTNLYRKP
jgi:hypothetical protein